MMRAPEILEQRRRELADELGEPITLDGLTAQMRIFQRKRGHRHSTDDVLTASYALDHAPDATSVLDLGTGIGTVGLLVASTGIQLSCVEAQDISYRLLRENLWANQVDADAVHGDLRTTHFANRFPLVTGSPPYWPITDGIVPADSQKAHARFELRGDVRDYARAAKAHLTDGGVFVFCFPWAQKARARAAARAEGFAVTSQDVIPRAGLAPLFSVFACRFGAPERPEHEDKPFVVRDAQGVHSDQMMCVRDRFGWPRVVSPSDDQAHRE
jgi:tRNA1Val (adenine37-N6)-methyltransferase